MVVCKFVRVHCVFQNKITIITLLRELPYYAGLEKTLDNLCSKYTNRLCNDKKSVIEKSTIGSFLGNNCYERGRKKKHIILKHLDCAH